MVWPRSEFDRTRMASSGGIAPSLPGVLICLNNYIYNIDSLFSLLTWEGTVAKILPLLLIWSLSL